MYHDTLNEQASGFQEGSKFNSWIGRLFRNPYKSFPNILDQRRKMSRRKSSHIRKRKKRVLKKRTMMKASTTGRE
jgi:hypothetical protein